MRSRFALLTAVLASLCWSGLATAETYPDRPIHIVVPFPPGASNDVVARFLGQKLSEITGQSVVVDNRAGANGNIGAEYVARSAPDGYTLLLTAPGPLAVNQALYSHLPFDPAKDFAPVALAASVQIVLTVNPKVKAKSVAELIALAKASPGKLNFGSSGVGSTNHLAGELLKKLAGINIVHVPYRGAAPAMNDLIAGQIPILFDNMPAVRPQALAGALRPLAVAGHTRSPLFPDLPTMEEAGVPGFEATSWFGLVAPAKTPPEVLKTLTEDVKKALDDPETAHKLSDVGAEPGTLFGDDFGKFLHTESEKWGKIVKDSGTVME
ncbi:MAG TPA: tripartite tricarboxylate transporter substrate binding protein [Bradyrhizobium sp.]|nr:tripartite tricarboxylate transporter substrate binding protein [Bradyrhizobium sp.]